MNVFIVFAHPEAKSFNGALKDVAVETLEKEGHKVVVSDLYRMNFRAAAGAGDFIKPENKDYLKMQTEQTKAYKEGSYADDLKAEMKKFEEADLVIFNFPLWWFSLPAILKGWVDRVFAMGFAYGAGKGVYENGAFPGKRAMLSFTTGGPAAAYGKTGKNGELETILFHIHHGMFRFVGMDVLAPFIAWAPARATDEERKKCLNDYSERLKKIFSEESMTW